MSHLSPNHVSFCGEFIKEHTPVHPAGRDIIEYLELVLPKHGIHVVEKEQTDYSQVIVVSVGKVRFSVEVGLVADANAEWLLFFSPCNLIYKVFSFFANKEHTLLVNTLHSVLSTNERISKIRWYKNSHAWNYKADKSYMETPNA